MDLQPYQELAVCRMCGRPSGHNISWCPGSDPSNRYQRDRCRAGIQEEHFHRSCVMCSYTSVEAVLSTSTAEVTEFDPLSPCIKCGLVASQQSPHGAHYCPGDTACTDGHGRPLIHRTCLRCGYQWDEEPLNQAFMVGVAQCDD
jgi:hypothetical protein